MTGFTFSIIMAVYDTQDYLDEAIGSVLNQDFDFKKHVQLILVDDGSNDDSYDVCLKYQKKYPENIVLAKSEHRGPAGARNVGLEYATGEFVNFLDSDDKLSLNVLSEVYAFFNEFRTDLVTIPIEYFGAKSGNQYMNYRFTKTGLIDLNERFDCPQMSVSTSFIRKEAIDDIRFNEKLANGEDLLFVNKILLSKLNYGVLNTAKYHYRKRDDSTSLMDNSFLSAEFFTDKLKGCYMELIDYCLKLKGNVFKFIQYVIVQDLHGSIRSSGFNKYVKDKEEFHDCLEYILSYIEEDIILSQRKLDEHAKSFLIFFKSRQFHIEKGDGKLSLKSQDHTINNVHNNKIRITKLDIEDDEVYLEGYINTCCYCDDFKVKANDMVFSVDENNSILSFAGVDWLFKHEFNFKFNLDDSLDIKIRSCYQKVVMDNKIRFMDDFNNRKDYTVVLEDNIIKIAKVPLKNKIRRVFDW